MTSRQLPRRARIISRPTLVVFKANYPDAADALDGWEDTITSLSFSSFGDLQRQIASVDYVNGTFLVFNILHRLLAAPGAVPEALLDAQGL